MYARISTLARYLVCCSAVTGCTNPVDGSENLLPTVERADSRPPAADGGPGDAAVAVHSCAQLGDVYRFDTMEMVTLGGGPHPLTNILNALWLADIERTELNVVFEVVESTATEVIFSAYNGARLAQGAGTYCGLSETEARMIYTRTEDGLVMSGTSIINVFAGAQAFPKNCAPGLEVPHTIPVRDVHFSLRFAEDCESFVSDGRQPVLMYYAELAQICTCPTAPDAYAERCGVLDPDYDGEGCGGCNSSYQNLLALMTNFGGLAFDCVGAGGEQALCAEVEFSGVKVAEIPPTCE